MVILRGQLQHHSFIFSRTLNFLSKYVALLCVSVCACVGQLVKAFHSPFTDQIPDKIKLIVWVGIHQLFTIGDFHRRYRVNISFLNQETN